MNDLSSATGYILNGKHFSSSAKFKLGGQVVGSRMIVLRDGDTIQIPNTPQGTYDLLRLNADVSPSLQT
jgi:hypothetical protein